MMTPEQNALANKYLQECRDYNERLELLIADNKWNSARLNTIIERLNNPDYISPEEHAQLSTLQRQISRRRDINVETYLKMDKWKTELSNKITALFGRKLW